MRVTEYFEHLFLFQVSAFGDSGKGDEGDHWALQCSGKYWRRNDNVRLKHIVTDKYVHVT